MFRSVPGTPVAGLCPVSGSIPERTAPGLPSAGVSGLFMFGLLPVPFPAGIPPPDVDSPLTPLPAGIPPLDGELPNGCVPEGMGPEGLSPNGWFPEGLLPIGWPTIGLSLFNQPDRLST